MNKKNNRSGFTLVELIVVMCLMGIIMGAVLNFIQPTAKLYKTTNTYLNEEEAVTTIANALEDDLMYATGVYVYATDDETKGPAEINNIVTEILNTPEHPNVKELSNCIVLDNVTVRDTPLAISKDSKGRILKYGWNGAQFMDVTTPGMLAGEKLYNNVFALQDQTFMGDDQFTFSIENSASSLNSMNIRIDVYRPSYNGTSYVYNEQTFSAVKAIEFLNIKAGNVTFNNNDVNTAASVSDPKYIYIFYNRKSRINANATSYPYECYVKDATNSYISDPVWQSVYYEGDDISGNVGTYAESSNIEMFIEGEYVYQRTGKYATVPNIEDENDVNVVDLTCMPAASSNPLKLYAVYTKSHVTSMPKSTVTFWLDKGMTSMKIRYNDVPFNTGVSLGNANNGMNLEPPSLDPFTSGEQRSYERWADCLTDEPVTDFSHILKDTNVYRQTYYYYAVTFLDTMGNEIDGNTLKDSEGNILGNNIPVIEGNTIAAMPDIAQSGLNTESGTYSWVNVDDTPFDATAPITGAVFVKLKFEEAPAISYSLDCTAGEINIYWNNNITISPINITNNGAEDIVDDITIKIKFDCNVAALTSPAHCWESCVENNGGVIDTTFSGDTVTIVVKFKADSSEKFSPGKIISLQNLTVSLTSETGKYVSIE